MKKPKGMNLHLLRQGWKILTYLYITFFAEGCTYRAAALTYSTLLSLVPLLIVMFYILSFFPVFKGTGEVIQNFIVHNFVAASAAVINQHLNIFLTHIQTLSWWHMLGLFFVSILMMYNLVRAFNAIWHVRLQRHFALSFLIYLMVLLVSPLFFGLLLLISSYLPFVTYLQKPFSFILPYLSSFVIFTIFNWILPSCRVRFWHAVIAAAITALLFEASKYLFALYLTYYSTYQIIYGALASIPFFLIWLYLAWSIVLLGVVLCRGLASDFNSFE